MFSVSSRTSAKTGVAPQWTITFAVAGQVIELVITSSPGPTPSATSERCRAAVADETASTCLTSRESRMRASSAAVRGPVGAAPERREDVARLAVDSHALDPLEPLGNLHRLEHAGRRDQEARDRAADPGPVPTWHKRRPERGIDGEVVQVDARDGLDELR